MYLLQRILVLVRLIHNVKLSFKSLFQAGCGTKGLGRKNGLSDEILVGSSHFRHAEELSNANLETKEVATEKLLISSILLCLSRSYRKAMPSAH